MSYNFTQLHEIIETQYKVNNDGSDKSLLNETAKLFKGYTTPTAYLNNIISNKSEMIIREDDPIYIDR